MNFIKTEIKKFLSVYSATEEIHTARDCRRVKKWIKKVTLLYGFFTALAIVFIAVVWGIATTMGPLAIFAVVASPIILLTGWGYASLILNFKQVAKAVIKSGMQGYEVGEKIETTNYEVTHEFGNTYRVSAHTENKGCLFAMIAGVARLMVWLFFCVYVAPFLTFRKLWRSVQNLKKYQEQ